MANSPTSSPEANPRGDLEETIATLSALSKEGLDAVFSSTSKRAELKKSLSLLVKSKGFLTPSQADAANLFSSILDSLFSTFDQNSQLKACLKDQMAELHLLNKLKSASDKEKKATARMEKLMAEQALVASEIAEARGELEKLKEEGGSIEILKEEGDFLKDINIMAKNKHYAAHIAKKELWNSHNQILSHWNCVTHNMRLY